MGNVDVGRKETSFERHSEGVVSVAVNVPCRRQRVRTCVFIAAVSDTGQERALGPTRNSENCRNR